jgi:hypothetical protein
MQSLVGENGSHYEAQGGGDVRVTPARGESDVGLPGWEGSGYDQPEESAAGVAKYARAWGIAALPRGWKYAVADELFQSDGTPIWGESNPRTKTVTIASGAFRNPDALRGVIFHERIHALQAFSNNLANPRFGRSFRMNEFEASEQELAYLRRTNGNSALTVDIQRQLNQMSLGDYYDAQIGANSSGAARYRIRPGEVWKSPYE